MVTVCSARDPRQWRNPRACRWQRCPPLCAGSVRATVTLAGWGRLNAMLTLSYLPSTTKARGKYPSSRATSVILVPRTTLIGHLPGSEALTALEDDSVGRRNVYRHGNRVLSSEERRLGRLDKSRWSAARHRSRAGRCGRWLPYCCRWRRSRRRGRFHRRGCGRKHGGGIRLRTVTWRQARLCSPTRQSLRRAMFSAAAFEAHDSKARAAGRLDWARMCPDPLHATLTKSTKRKQRLDLVGGHTCGRRFRCGNIDRRNKVDSGSGFCGRRGRRFQRGLREHGARRRHHFGMRCDIVRNFGAGRR